MTHYSQQSAARKPSASGMFSTPCSSARGWISVAAVLIILVWSYGQAEIDPLRLIDGLGNAWRYVAGSEDRPGSGFFPPSTARLDIYLGEMIVTIKMAIWGTALCIPISLALAFLGANNVTGTGAVYWFSRRIMDFLRSLNELIIALIFVAAVGLGPFSGVMALAVGGIGSLGKLLSEAIEGLDMGQIEAVKATGAGPLQIILKGFVPQMLPAFVSFVLYRFESNVRAATVLGVVGAGGIGYYLQEAMRSFDNRNVCTILLIIVAAVIVIDNLSASIRRRLG